MSIVYCGVCPHPPIAVPEVGQAEADKVIDTQKAYWEMGRRVKESGAETMVIISPHAPVFRDVVGINGLPVLKGDLGGFRAPQVAFELKNDRLLVSEIQRQARDLGLDVVQLGETMERQYDINLQLDHGVTVPLYFFQKAGVKLPLVHVSMAVAPPEKLYLFGLAVRRATESLERKAALLASGDLSHGLIRSAPSGYRPRGKEFDVSIVKLLAGADIAGVLKMDQDLVQQAGECGYRSIVMMLGALDGYEVKAEILSYEGPFGVGYLVASLEPGMENKEHSLYGKLQDVAREEMARRRAGESFLVKVARDTLERHVKGELRPVISTIPEEFGGRAGVFVSIKKHGNLRGCIGTIAPVRPNIVEEVVANAVSAGARDPRFHPVRPEELPDLEYSVDVLQLPEPVNRMDELDPKEYGVIVRSGHRSGLLLPNLEGVDTVDEQVSIARQKAGIGPNEPVQLERFKVVRYK
ncbi:MAG: AmmeMemoRadiSam system protein A [Desulfotomaculaceae bacterium]|nr:AmmeMemoRadiSam system protein A [Desulfotomaculaceae bacterium]